MQIGTLVTMLGADPPLVGIVTQLKLIDEKKAASVYWSDGVAHDWEYEKFSGSYGTRVKVLQCGL